MRLPRVALVCLTTLFLFGCPSPAPEDVCAAVNCGAGRCIPTNGQAACLCDTTYVAQGLSCVLQTQADACASNPCAATGKLCSSFNGAAICNCPTGYVDQGAGCVKQNPCNPNPCTAANQSCQGANGAAICVCNAGYTPVGTGCSTEPTFNCAKNHSGSTADDQFEPNECPESSTAYDFSASSQIHTLSPAGDEDWIRISPLSGNIVAVDFTNSTVPLYIDVYSQDGVTPVASDHRGVNMPSFRFLAKNAETHYIRIRGLRANDVGTYTLTISDAGQDDYTNVASNALSIAPGGSFDGEVQYAGDEDVIKMPVQAGRTYRLLMNTTTATGIQVDVVGADGSTRKTLTRAVPTTGTTHTVFAKLNGEITLRARSEGLGTLGTFSVALLDYGVDDHGDLVIDATTLTPSASNRTGTFETRPTGAPADIDVFSFAVEAGHIYAFTCTAGLYNYGCVMAMRDEAGTVLVQGSGSSVKTIAFEATTNGTWNLSAQPYASYLGAITYKLEDLGTDDFGDVRTAAAPITVGTPKAGRIELANDVDFFSFTATAAHIYQVGCTPDTTLYYCSTRILDAAGVQVGAASTSTITFEATSSSPYFIEIKPYYSGYSGTYSLNVADIGTDDHGDTAPTATTLTSGTARAGSIEVGGDVDFFGIPATTNNIYSVSCTTSASYLCYLIVRDPAGTTITSTSYGTATTASFRALSTGTYTVEAKAYYSTYTGAYSVTFTNNGVDDHADTSTGATALTLGAATAGSIQFAGDRDVFSFTVTSGRIYKAACTTSATYQCQLTVRNPSGTVVASAVYGTATAASFESAVGGTFTVEVSSYSTAYTGSYSLTVTDEGLEDHGDTMATATPITVGGSPVGGKIEMAYDLDFFSFTATANRLYRFTCTSTDYYVCVMTVRNSSGTALQTSSYAAGSASTVTFLASTATTFYVEAKAYSTYTGTYSLQLFDDGVEDHGNTIATATTLTPGAAAATGKIEVGGDVDVFSFNATANRIYRFSCTSSTSYMCVLTARNAAGTLITSTSYGTSRFVSFTAPTTAAYNVEVKAYYSSTIGTYTYQLFDDGVDDYGDTAATSTTTLTLPSTISGNIQSSTDKDVLKFNAVSQQLYKFTCTGSDFYGCKLVVRDGSNLTVGTSTYGTQVTYFLKAATAGLFSVEVSNANFALGSWSLTVEATTDDHGDTIAAATAITPGVSVTGNHEFVGDYDYFAVNLNASTTYTISSIGSPQIYPYILAYTSAGVAIGADNVYQTRAFTTTTAGTYYFRLRPYSASYLGAYTVRIQ